MSNTKTRIDRSPPEDKRLSLEKDCRDSYGENNKAKRKAIPRFKAASNRVGRHTSKSLIAKATIDIELVDEAALHKATLKATRPTKTKVNDRPLKDVLARKNAREKL
ncbi:hypothetical protein [Phyllobacterium sp. K27]